MLANWVKQGTSTTGTGTITLDGTPPAGYVAFSDAFNDGEGIFYVIEDGNNREVGYGELTAGASWTLTRGIVYEKLEGGVHERFPATPLNLSGSAVVTIDATAQAMIGSPILNHASTSSTRQNTRIAHLWRSRNSASTLTLAADTIYLYPAFLATPMKVLGIGTRINTAATVGTKLRLGVYAVTSAWRSTGKLLVESGDIGIGSTGTVTSSLASPVYLNPGWYWLACLSDGDPKLECWDAGETPGTHGIIGTSSYTKLIYDRWSQSVSAGWAAMPSQLTAVTSSIGGASLPSIFLEVA